jgi:hypothetical protein
MWRRVRSTCGHGTGILHWGGSLRAHRDQATESHSRFAGDVTRLVLSSACLVVRPARIVFNQGKHSGYTQATFTGDAVDDTLLQLTAVNTNLTHLSVTAAPKVTDAGISAAVMASPGLTQLSVGGTSVNETYGHFLSKVLALKNITKFEIKSQLLAMQETPSRPCASSSIHAVPQATE